jgi:uncharacterized protein YfaS (alpha-2-macroglobulin family)
MVDEGLLDITKFKTPDPWKKFYAREALGVRTWDFIRSGYGCVWISHRTAACRRWDEESKATEEDPRANRFKPVVKFFGPVTIDAGR